jgi:hypothetical protein
MVNDKMLNGFMEKKQYIAPLSEVTLFESDVIMQAFGPASMPDDSFKSGAPKRVPTLSNDSVQVF